jgi:hypothetical protein
VHSSNFLCYTSSNVRVHMRMPNFEELGREVSRSGNLLSFQNSPEATEEIINPQPGWPTFGLIIKLSVSEYERCVQDTIRWLSVFILQA